MNTSEIPAKEKSSIILPNIQVVQGEENKSVGIAAGKATQAYQGHLLLSRGSLGLDFPMFASRFFHSIQPGTAVDMRYGEMMQLHLEASMRINSEWQKIFQEPVEKNTREMLRMIGAIENYKVLAALFAEMKRHWLHFACEAGDADVIRSLNPNVLCEDLKVGDVNGCTPFYYAVKGGHVELVKYLFDKGEIDFCSLSPAILLEIAYSACIEGNIPVLESILFLAEKENASGFKKILEEGAEASCPSLLEIAADVKQVQAIEYLLSHLSCTTEVQQLLIKEYGPERFRLKGNQSNECISKAAGAADAARVDKDGITRSDSSNPAYSTVDRAKALDVLVEDMLKGAREWGNEDAKLVYHLIDLGVDPMPGLRKCSKIYKEGVCAPLAMALMKGVEAVDVNSRDEDDQATLLELAIESNNPEMVELLVRQGASPFIPCFHLPMVIIEQVVRKFGSGPTDSSKRILRAIFSIKETRGIQKLSFFFLRCADCFKSNGQINEPLAKSYFEILAEDPERTSDNFDSKVFDIFPALMKSFPALAQFKDSSFAEMLENLIPFEDYGRYMPEKYPAIPNTRFEAALSLLYKGEFNKISEIQLKTWRNDQGETLVHAAINRGYIARVVELLRLFPGDYLQSYNNAGNSSIEEGFALHPDKMAPIVKLLGERGEKIERVRPLDNVRFTASSKDGVKETIKALVEGRSDPGINSQLVYYYIATLYLGYVDDKEYAWELLDMVKEIKFLISWVDVSLILDLFRATPSDDKAEIILNELRPHLPTKMLAKNIAYQSMLPLLLKFSLERKCFSLLANHFKVLPVNCGQGLLSCEEEIENIRARWKSLMDPAVKDKAQYFYLEEQKGYLFVEMNYGMGCSIEIRKFSLTDHDLAFKLTYQMGIYCSKISEMYSNDFDEKVNEGVYINFRQVKLFSLGIEGVCGGKPLATIHPSLWPTHLNNAIEQDRKGQELFNHYFKGNQTQDIMRLRCVLAKKVTMDANCSTNVLIWCYGRFLFIAGRSLEKLVLDCDGNMEEAFQQLGYNKFQGIVRIVDIPLWELDKAIKGFELERLLQLNNNEAQVRGFLQRYHPEWLPLMSDRILQKLHTSVQLTFKQIDFQKQTVAFNYQVNGGLKIYQKNLYFWHLEKRLDNLNLLQNTRFSPGSSSLFDKLTMISKAPLDLTVSALQDERKLLEFYDRHYQGPDKIKLRQGVEKLVSILNDTNIAVGGSGEKGLQLLKQTKELAQKVIEIFPGLDSSLQATIVTVLAQIGLLCLPRIRVEMESLLRMALGLNTQAEVPALHRLLAKALDSARRNAWYALLQEITGGEGIDPHLTAHLANSLSETALPPDLSMQANSNDTFLENYELILVPMHNLRMRFNHMVLYQLIPMFLEVYEEAMTSSDPYYTDAVAALNSKLKRLVIEEVAPKEKQTEISDKQEKRDCRIKLLERREDADLQDLVNSCKNLRTQLKDAKTIHQESCEDYYKLKKVIATLEKIQTAKAGGANSAGSKRKREEPDDDASSKIMKLGVEPFFNMQEEPKQGQTLLGALYSRFEVLGCEIKEIFELEEQLNRAEENLEQTINSIKNEIEQDFVIFEQSVFDNCNTKLQWMADQEDLHKNAMEIWKKIPYNVKPVPEPIMELFPVNSLQIEALVLFLIHEKVIQL